MWVLIAAEVVSACCLVHLLRRRRGHGLGTLVFWGLFLMVPVVGPLFYGAATPRALPRRRGGRAMDSEWIGTEGYPRTDDLGD